MYSLLGITPSRKEQWIGTAITDAMKQIGFEKKPKKLCGKPKLCFVKGEGRQADIDLRSLIRPEVRAALHALAFDPVIGH